MSRRAILHRLLIVAIAIMLSAVSPLSAQVREKLVTYIASGTFEIKMQPLPDSSVEGVKRMTFDKQLHGGLEGSAKGEMIYVGDPQEGVAGYVAIELMTGKLNGKSGSFALQHTATMDKSGQMLQIVVSPGSGTGELKGLAGRFEIKIAGGQHSYTFEYTLPVTE